MKREAASHTNERPTLNEIVDAGGEELQKQRTYTKRMERAESALLVVGALGAGLGALIVLMVSSGNGEAFWAAHQATFLSVMTGIIVSTIALNVGKSYTMQWEQLGAAAREMISADLEKTYGIKIPPESAHLVFKDRGLALTRDGRAVTAQFGTRSASGRAWNEPIRLVRPSIRD